MQKFVFPVLFGCKNRSLFYNLSPKKRILNYRRVVQNNNPKQNTKVTKKKKKGEK